MIRQVRRFFILSLSVAAVFALSAQTTSSEEGSVFAPFVSRIRVAVKDDLVKVSWLDSHDAIGPVFLYRSKYVFSSSSLPKAELVTELPYGTQSYIDHPPSTGPWYYFVAASDEQGTRYDILLPFGNTSGAPVSVTLKTETDTESVEADSGETIKTEASALSKEETASVVPAPTEMTLVSPPSTQPQSMTASDENVDSNPTAKIEEKAVTVQALAPLVSKPAFSAVTASVNGDAVEINFKAERKVVSALLYRSATPLRRVADLLDAIIVLAGPPEAPMIDYPVPGIAYYYALLDENELKSGSALIEIGVNTTVQAATVPAGLYRIGLPGPSSDLRSMPLPLISLHSLGETSPSLTPSPLSPEATKIIKRLVSVTEPKELSERRPRVFPQDLEAPAGGEEYTLRSIVQGTFAKRDWRKAITELSGYLSLSRTALTEARARFYLGQSYYFQNQYREALFEFLLVQEQYSAEAREWIQAVLRHLIDV